MRFWNACALPSPAAILVSTTENGTMKDDEGLAGDLRSVKAPLDEATTLPGRFYHDPAILRAGMERWAGFLFVTLSADAPPLIPHLGEMAHKFDRYRMADLKRGRRIAYTVGANWKILAENYSECYHCFLIHPELNRVSHYRSGEMDLVNAATVGGYMELREDAFNTMSLSGHTARRPIATIEPQDLRRIHYYIVYPNLFLSLHPDYVMTHTVWPDGPGRSEVLCEFLFEPEEAARAGFDPSDAVDFWDLTNRQDWKAGERAQLGGQSASYDRG